MKKWVLFLLCLTTGLWAGDQHGIKRPSSADNSIENRPPTKKQKLDPEDIEPEGFTIDLNGPVPLSPAREEPQENQRPDEEGERLTETESCDDPIFVSFEQEIKTIQEDQRGKITIEKSKDKTNTSKLENHKDKVVISFVNFAVSKFDFRVYKLIFKSLRFLEIKGLYQNLESFLCKDKLPVVEVISLELSSTFPVNLFKRKKFQEMDCLKKIHINNIFFYPEFSRPKIQEFFRDTLHNSFPSALEYICLNFKNPVFDLQKERDNERTDRGLASALEAVRTFNPKVPNTFIVDGTNVWDFLDKTRFKKTKED